MDRLGGLLALALALLAVPAVQAQEGPPPEACFLPRSPTVPVFGDLAQAQCAVAHLGWELVWYYPPGAYQAWCFLTGDCPCPHCPEVRLPAG